MNAHAELRMDAPTFLRWAEGRVGRHELAGGRVRSMVGASGDHVEIAGNLFMALRPVLNRGRFRVSQGDFAVEVADGVRYPDVMVWPRGVEETRLSTRAPVLIAEVLSCASAYIDFNDKLTDYLALASLRTYLVLSHTEPCAHVWERGADGVWPPSPVLVNDPAAVIALPALGASLALADLYAGIGG